MNRIAETGRALKTNVLSMVARIQSKKKKLRAGGSAAVCPTGGASPPCGTTPESGAERLTGTLFLADDLAAGTGPFTP